MRVYEPFLKKRIDGSKPSSNPKIGAIESHFRCFNQLSFHFGTNQAGIVQTYAWKVLVTDKPLDNSVDESDQIIQAIKEFYTDKRNINDTSFLKKHGFEFSFIVFYDQNNWKLENSIIYKIVPVVNFGGLTFTSKRFTQKEFQKLIVDLNGQNLTNKPLIYATTEFEGFLSDVCVPGTTRNDVSLFPGDVDLALYNDEYKTITVVEFKKHTPSGQGSIEYQSFTKYYYRDKKKYTTLAKITAALGKEYFYNVIYSTRPNELLKLKVEKITTNMRLVSSMNMSFSTIEEMGTYLTNNLR